MRKMATRLCAIMALTLLALALAGCGRADNDGHNEATANSAPSAGGAILSMAQVATSYDAAPQEVRADGSGTSMSYGEAGSPPSVVTGVAFGAADRKLIYRANVTMQVADYAEAQTLLLDMVSISGGYVLSFNDSQLRHELGGHFVLKVPSQGFQPFLTELETLKEKNFQRHVQGQDVSEEYVDLTSRLKAKQVVEERLLGFMETATDTNNLLQVSAELARVQEEIETIKGRMRYLDEHVAYSTIELRMYERLTPEKEEEERPGVLHRAGKALTGSGEGVFRFLEGAVVFIAGAIPVIVMVGIVALPVIYVIRRRRKASAEQTKQHAYVTKVDSSKDEQ